MPFNNASLKGVRFIPQCCEVPTLTFGSCGCSLNMVRDGKISLPHPMVLQGKQKDKPTLVITTLHGTCRISWCSSDKLPCTYFHIPLFNFLQTFQVPVIFPDYVFMTTPKVINLRHSLTGINIPQTHRWCFSPETIGRPGKR